MTDSAVVAAGGVIVSIEYDSVFYPVFCAKNSTFSVTNEIIQRTSVGDGLGIKRRVRKTDWGGSASGVTVVDNTTDRYSAFFLLQEAVRRAVNTWQFEYTSIGGIIKTVTGEAVIEGIEITGDAVAFSQSTVNILGSGTPSIDISPVPPTAENVDSDYWNCVEGEVSVSGAGVGGKTTVGKQLLAVARTGTPHVIITAGVAGNLEAKYYTGTGVTEFSSSLPFNSGEVVWQMWKDA